MPVIPVVAGLATAGAGVAAAAAATTAFATFAAGAMIVGGAMTTIGGITGNKKLMTAGAVIGLAGGIGSWAAGTFGAASSSVAAEGAEVAAFGANVNASAAGVAIDAGVSAGAAGAGAAGTSGGAFSSASPEVFDTLSEAGTQAAAGTGQVGTTPASGGLTNTATTAPNSPYELSLKAMKDSASKPPSFFDKLENGLDSLSKYDKLVNMVGGAADAYFKEKQNRAYTEQTDKDRAFAEEQWRTSQANANAKFNIPMSYVPNQGGLINTAMQPRIQKGAA